MKIPRGLTVFLCSAGAILTLGIIKALVVSGIDSLPPIRVLLFASGTFGFVAALLDWGLLRDLFGCPKKESPSVAVPLRPIVFRELCPARANGGLSFYGGVPIGPETLVWPKMVNKPGGAPLSFVMQWDSAELARQDATGVLPRDGALYLFADLTWGDPFDFQFINASGPVQGWQRLPLPPGLPAIYGDEGAYQVPYCSPQVAKESQDVPRLLPKWPFEPMAFSYPAAPAIQECYWDDGERTAKALLLLEYPEGVPPAERIDKQLVRFARPFAAFPHDYAAVRVIAAKVLAATKDSQNEAAHRYAFAAKHRPGARVDQALSDEMWHWMEGLEPVLGLSWGSLVEECANVSLGLQSEAAHLLPADLVARCTQHHRLAATYLHKGIQSISAPCPNHMFGLPSYVQGDVEEYLKDWVLLLELSSRRPIGHEFGEGVLQFLIRPSDLREGRFDKVKLIASAY